MPTTTTTTPTPTGSKPAPRTAASKLWTPAQRKYMIGMLGKRKERLEAELKTCKDEIAAHKDALKAEPGNTTTTSTATTKARAGAKNGG